MAMGLNLRPLGIMHTARNAGAGGGGVVGATCPHNLEAVGAPPPPQFWTVNVVHLFFCLFLQVKLGLSPKIVG